MFSTTNSTNPRVFINAPSENDCDQLIPVQRLINMLPPSLPAIATTITSAHNAQLCQSFSKLTCVRNPVNAKNNGNNAAALNASNFSRKNKRNSADGGITTPATNAPNNA